MRLLNLAVRGARGAARRARSARCSCRGGRRRRSSPRPGSAWPAPSPNLFGIAYNDGLGVAAVDRGPGRRPADPARGAVAASRSWRSRCSPRSAACPASRSSWRSASRRCWRRSASTCTRVSGWPRRPARCGRRRGGSGARRRVLRAVRGGGSGERLVVPAQPPRVRLVHGYQLHHRDAGAAPALRLPRDHRTGVVVAQAATTTSGARSPAPVRCIRSRAGSRRRRSRSASSCSAWRSCAGGSPAAPGRRWSTPSPGR